MKLLEKVVLKFLVLTVNKDSKTIERFQTRGIYKTLCINLAHVCCVVFNLKRVDEYRKYKIFK